jgi:membrane associated rhomboid family serine protease/tetratricopeptide (TPR) repeat protein
VSEPHGWAIERGEPRTPATWALAGLLVLAHAWTLLEPGAEVEVLERLGANWGPSIRQGEWWRLLASTILHAGVLHLLFNLWALVSLGRAVEIDLGTRRFLLLYASCGALASTASVAWHPYALSVGASGAIFGLMGAVLTMFVRRRRRMAREAFRTGLSSLLLMVLVNIAFGLVVPVVDNAAHLGGLVSGIALSWLLSSRRPWLGIVACVASPAIAHPLLLARIDAVPEQKAAWERSEALHAALDAEDPERALALLDAGLQADPEDIRLRELRAILLEAVGRVDDARADYGHLWNASGEATWLSRRATLALAARRHDLALADYELLAKQEGREAEAEHGSWLARVAQGGDSRVLAEEAANRLGERRRRGDELAYAALLRRGAGLLGVEEMLDMARAVDAEGGTLQLAESALGEALLASGDLEAARAHLSRAVELADEHGIEDGWTMLARRRLAELELERR